jgi:hypothetical protein
MSVQTVSGTDLTYHLLAFDADGREREESFGGLGSAAVRQSLTSEAITDVFIMSHGWQGDMPGAKRQYEAWVGAMAAQSSDREKARQVRKKFRPLMVGLHWPSLLWGDETLSAATAVADVPDTPTARQALGVIAAAADREQNPPKLPAEVIGAYEQLDSETGLGPEGAGSRPGCDRDPFDPGAVFDLTRSDPPTFGLPAASLLSPLRTLTFWRMKDRARRFGESGAFSLLKALLQDAAGQDIRFHLMGHSFGCIVVSAALTGPDGQGDLGGAVHSLFLAQGAMSLWSYCTSIPKASGRAGYFRRVLESQLVRGPIVTTTSLHDKAVGRWYPLAAQAARQIVFASTTQLPTYGAVGAFGLQGTDLRMALTMDVQRPDQGYSWQPGLIHNLECSSVICEGGGFSGAHCDIARPEVAHAVWEAALAEEPSERTIYFNGINGASGKHLTRWKLPEVLRSARLEQTRSDAEQKLMQALGKSRKPGAALPLPFDVKAENVAKAGWAVIFGPNTAHDVKQALEPLLKHRKSRVAPDRYKEFDYCKEETAQQWLLRHGAAWGTISPSKVPYYLLLIGGPESIPFKFQYQLDIEYAVGRLAFPKAEEYGCYARHLVDYEKAASVVPSREIVYWATRHNNLDATAMSADWLVKLLYEGRPATPEEAEELAIAKVLGFTSQLLFGKDATRSRLLDILHPAAGAAPPTVLFTASHGLGWPPDHERHETAQGALLCQDYPGFGLPVQPSHYVAANDITDQARMHGMVAFLFACFGGGTPEFNDYLYEGDHDCNFLYEAKRPERIAAKPFISALPRRLLAHPNGSVLGVVGHTERAWGYSIRPLDSSFQPLAGVGPQLAPFRNFLGALLGGMPIGHAMKDLNERAAILAAGLLDQLDPRREADPPFDSDLAWTWVERNDARNYVLLGDPAARLRVELLNSPAGR